MDKNRQKWGRKWVKIVKHKNEKNGQKNDKKLLKNDVKFLTDKNGKNIGKKW